ncbi:MAG: nitronate monooxygenase [Thermomicrobiales bacterium]
MVRTDLCDLLDSAHPIVQAAIWPATAPELVAAVANAGGLGTLSSWRACANRIFGPKGAPHGYPPLNQGQPTGPADPAAAQFAHLR